ncbi:hypothetical protein D3C87_1695110 [compost metagenome]
MMSFSLSPCDCKPNRALDRAKLAASLRPVSLASDMNWLKVLCTAASGFCVQLSNTAWLATSEPDSIWSSGMFMPSKIFKVPVGALGAVEMFCIIWPSPEPMLRNGMPDTPASFGPETKPGERKLPSSARAN